MTDIAGIDTRERGTATRQAGDRRSTAHRFGEARDSWWRNWAVPLLLIVASPPIPVLLWMAIVHFDGSLLAMATQPERVLALWPWPSFTALAIIGVWVGLQAALLVLLPGRAYEGPVTPMGNRPRYKLNGVLAFIVAHALLAIAAYPLGLFSPGIVYDHFGELLMTLSAVALILCAILFAKGVWAPSSSDAGRSGNVVWDFYWGVELHPRLGGIELKQLVNCRIAMMGWSVIVLSFAAKAHAIGSLSLAMILAAGLQVVYIFKFFVWESGYLASIDIMHDRFGFYIAWGILAWLPGIYTLAPLYLVAHPVTLPALAGVAIAALGLVAIYANYQADEQRQRVRATAGKTTIWGRAPEVLKARYHTADGMQRENLLLLSGWWGVARHFHYTAEILTAVAWTLPVGFSHFAPWFYPVFLTILLVDRAGRDELRCRGKYGRFWQQYCARVPWRIVPGVY